MAVIEGAISGNLGEVDANNNQKVTLPTDPAEAGYARILDANGNNIFTTENGALNTSLDGVVLFEQVDGSALNTNLWTSSVDTMTVTQGNGFITLNANSTTTANKYAILQSVKYIPFYAHLPMKIAFNMKVPIQPQANITMEIGVGLVSGNSAPTDGAFFRWNSSTEFRCVINNGGSEISSTPITAPANNDVFLLEMVIVEDEVEFLIDDVIVAEVPVALGQAYPTNAGRLPLFARVYNGASTPATAAQINVGQVIVVQQAMNQNKAWSDTLSALGRSAYQSPITPYTQNSNHANSTSPTSASLSNTAAGYTTLGGRYQFAAVGGAATDYALFAYQVPSGYQLYINAITINAINTGAAVATTATILDWALGINGSAVSLATSESPPTSWATRRIPLGTQGLVVGAAIGTNATDISRIFPTPLVVDSGRYVHVILQVPVGTATGSQIIRGDVQINGYFE